MNEVSRQTLQKRSRLVGKAVGAAFWCLAVLTVWLLFLTLWMSFRPAGEFTLQSLWPEHLAEPVLYGFFQQGYSVQFDKVALSQAGLGSAKAVFLLDGWCTLAMGAFQVGALWNVRAVFREIRDRVTPFTPRTGRAVFRTGACILAASLAGHTAFPLLCFFTGLASGFHALFDAGELLVGSIVVCPSFAFRYGAALQAESDETL